MSEKEIIDIRSFRIPVAYLILEILEYAGYEIHVDDLENEVKAKENHLDSIKRMLEITSEVNFTELKIREELDILIQLKLATKRNNRYKITDKGKKYIDDFSLYPKRIIELFFKDLYQINSLFRSFFDKLKLKKENVTNDDLRGAHHRSNKQKVSFFKTLIQYQFKLAEKKDNGLYYIGSDYVDLETESLDIKEIADNLLRIYRDHIENKSFLTLDFLWKKTLEIYINVIEEQFDNAINFLMIKYLGKVNGVKGVVPKGDKITKDRLTGRIFQYLEIYPSVYQEL